jgi:hypothetical protein
LNSNFMSSSPLLAFGALSQRLRLFRDYSPARAFCPDAFRAAVKL